MQDEVGKLLLAARYGAYSSLSARTGVLMPIFSRLAWGKPRSIHSAFCFTGGQEGEVATIPPLVALPPVATGAVQFLRLF